MTKIAEKLFARLSQVRYVALYRGGEPELYERPAIEAASGCDSDRFEEILVNPTLLTLARQRGELDCGGLEYLVIRYGNFFQLVHPIAGGHISVAIEPDADPIAVVEVVRALVADAGLAF